MEIDRIPEKDVRDLHLEDARNARQRIAAMNGIDDLLGSGVLPLGFGNSYRRLL